jgi:DNA repair exonuclease SbcCD ATPase subunit
MGMLASSLVFLSLVTNTVFFHPRLWIPEPKPVKAAAVVKAMSLEEVRSQRREAIEEAREARREAWEETQEAREEFRNRLQEIKDARKRIIVERISNLISKINDKWISRWNGTLTRLSEILAKIESRADKLAEEGKDVDDVYAAISEAEEAIATAQDAVNEQAGKTYIIEITDEETLGESVSSTIGEFHSDLQAVMEEVREAASAVRRAFGLLKEIVIESEIETEGGES